MDPPIPRRTRRRFLAGSLGALGLSASGRAGAVPTGFRPAVTQLPALAGKLGLVTASLSPHLGAGSSGARLDLLDFPAFLHGELDLKVIDFNTMNFPELTPAYAERLRTAVEKAGCLATNLKMNQQVDMASADAGERAEAMRQYRNAIDAAAILGCRWVRPLPRSEKPDETRQLAAFDELIDYAGERGLTVLLENFGWAMDDPAAIPRLADAIGKDRVAIGPDTGNWSDNGIREAGLALAFPRAVTCDFKAKVLGPAGEHPAYDLRRCFEIGWEAGFRGPWCFEHGHAELATAVRGIAFLRDSLRSWMASA